MAFQLSDLYPLLVIAFYAKQFSISTDCFPFLELWVQTENRYPTDDYNFPAYCKLASYIHQTYGYDAHIIRECGMWLCIQVMGEATTNYHYRYSSLVDKISSLSSKLAVKQFIHSTSDSERILRLPSILTSAPSPLYNELIFIYKRGDVYFTVTHDFIEHSTDAKDLMHLVFGLGGSLKYAFDSISLVLAKCGEKDTPSQSINQMQFKVSSVEKIQHIEVLGSLVLDGSNPLPYLHIDQYCEQLEFLIKNGNWPTHGPINERSLSVYHNVITDYFTYDCTERITNLHNLLELLNEIAKRYGYRVTEELIITHERWKVEFTTPINLRPGNHLSSFHVKKKVCRYFEFVNLCASLIGICVRRNIEVLFTVRRNDIDIDMSINVPYYTSDADVFKPKGFVPGVLRTELIIISNTDTSDLKLTCVAGVHYLSLHDVRNYLKDRLDGGVWKIMCE